MIHETELSWKKQLCEGGFYWLSLMNDVLALVSTMFCENQCCERKKVQQDGCLNRVTNVVSSILYEL